jgi:hypothetical protein
MKTTTTQRAKLARNTSLATLIVLFFLALITLPGLARADAVSAAPQASAQSADEVAAVLVLAPPKTTVFGFWQSILGNKVRMIQVATIGMALGIMLLWWGKVK